MQVLLSGGGRGSRQAGSHLRAGGAAGMQGIFWEGEGAAVKQVLYWEGAGAGIG